jgi:hypothetical protein
MLPTDAMQPPHSLWDCTPAVPSMCGKEQQQQQQHQPCLCVLGACSCPRGLTHAHVADAASPSLCSVDPAAVASFVPATHPLMSKTRCVSTQQYVEAKRKVLVMMS